MLLSLDATKVVPFDDYSCLNLHSGNIYQSRSADFVRVQLFQNTIDKKLENDTTNFYWVSPKTLLQYALFHLRYVHTI